MFSPLQLGEENDLRPTMKHDLEQTERNRTETKEKKGKRKKDRERERVRQTERERGRGGGWRGGGGGWGKERNVYPTNLLVNAERIAYLASLPVRTDMDLMMKNDRYFYPLVHYMLMLLSETASFA